MQNSKLPRGLNNNNPGNIEKDKLGKIIWQGEIESTDPRFAQFVDISYGYRAMFKILSQYQLKYKKTTIQDMINMWAPPTENQTADYAQFVAKGVGIQVTDQISIEDKDKMIKMVAFMSKMENGIVAKIGDVEKGWELFKQA